MSKKNLYILSIIYLSTSTLLFDIFWLKLSFAIPFALVFIVAFYLIIRQIIQDNSLKVTLPKKELWTLLGLSFLLVITSGAGGFSFQNFDYQFHNAKFYDLFAYDLPSYYPQIDEFPCYYFGYYLPVSLLAKMIGIQSLPWLSFFWTFLGVFLGVVWLYLIANQQFKIVLLFFFCGGVLSFFITIFTDYNKLLTSGTHPFSGAFLQYLPFVAQLQWVPNQFIPTLIGTGVIIHDIYLEKKIFRPYFLVLATIFWSPFPAVGMCLIFGFLMIRHWYLNPNTWKNIFKEKLYLTITTITFLPIMLYLSANNGGQVFGFISKFESNWLWIWLIFIISRVLVLFVLIPRQELFLKPILIFSTAVLCLIPCLKIGMCNDYCVRLSMPFLLILYLCFAKSIFVKRPKTIKVLSIIVLIIGMTIPVKFLGRGVMKFDPTGYHTIHYDKFKNTYEGLLWGYGKVGANEYLCRKPTFFYEEMLRKKQGEKPRI